MGKNESEDTVYGKSLGLTGTRISRVIRNLGGVKKLKSLSPEVRAVLLAPWNYGNSKQVKRGGLKALGMLKAKDEGAK